jgi:hypothetical protein
MTLTIHLKPEVEARLAAQPRAKGVSVAEYIGSSLEQFNPTGQQMIPEQRVHSLHEWITNGRGFLKTPRHCPTKPEPGKPL